MKYTILQQGAGQIKSLIKINAVSINDEAVQTVNARDLHIFLESKQDFSTWIKSRIEQYDFIENADFVKFHKKMDRKNQQLTNWKNPIEYFITLDMAKELSMVERNAKGKEARQYFIDCEKKAKAIHQLPSATSTGLPEFRKARSIKMMLDTANGIFVNLPNLGEQSKQAVLASLINPVAGAEIVKLPAIEEKTYSATEVGSILGISSNKIGSIANKCGLKTPEYGQYVLDKSRYSAKQVETFRYNQKGIDAISNELSSSH